MTIDRIAVESDSGFCYSLELLVKCHRLGWPVSDVSAKWFERKQGASRFQVLVHTIYGLLVRMEVRKVPVVTLR